MKITTTVISYNIESREHCGFSAQLKNFEKQKVELISLIKSEKPDIIHLQSLPIFGIDELPMIFKEYHVIYGLKYSRDFKDKTNIGSATLVKKKRYDVIDHDVYYYNDKTGNFLVDAVVMDKIAQQAIKLVNTHIAQDTSNSIGNSQVKELAKLFELDKHSKEIPWIISGDFNDIATSERLTLLTQKGFTLDPNTSATSIASQRKIDHIASKGFSFISSITEKGTGNYFGHHPLISTLTMKTQGNQDSLSNQDDKPTNKKNADRVEQQLYGVIRNLFLPNLIQTYGKPLYYTHLSSLVVTLTEQKSVNDDFELQKLMLNCFNKNDPLQVIIAYDIMCLFSIINPSEEHIDVTLVSQLFKNFWARNSHILSNENAVKLLTPLTTIPHFGQALHHLGYAAYLEQVLKNAEQQKKSSNDPQSKQQDSVDPMSGASSIQDVDSGAPTKTEAQSKTPETPRGSDTQPSTLSSEQVIALANQLGLTPFKSVGQLDAANIVAKALRMPIELSEDNIEENIGHHEDLENELDEMLEILLSSQSTDNEAIHRARSILIEWKTILQNDIELLKSFLITQ